MRPSPQVGAMQHPGMRPSPHQAPMQPSAMRPSPAQGMRPLPPGSAPRAAPMRPTPPGANGALGPMPGNMQQAPPVNNAGATQNPPAQLPSSAMPRPCAVEPKCGTPRPYFYRGMIANLDQGAGSAVIPSANSDFIAVDDGSSSLRYMRITTSAIASEPATMAKSGVPLAVVMSPFADPKQGESGIPVVDFSIPKEGAPGSGGPLRCDKCRAYANPGFKFLSGGSVFQCNMCGATCDTPAEHYSPISPANGLRVDIDSRHELRYGSVDYIVGNKDYQVRDPKPAKYVYAVDVSAAAVQSGLATAALYSIRLAINAGLVPGAKQGARVAVFTYDDSLHFYDARGADEGRVVSVHVVPDVNDPFVPLGGDGFFLTPSEAVAAVDAILESHAQSPSPGAALGSALHAIHGAMKETGGKAFVVAGSIPSAGVDTLERRGGGAVGGGEEREQRLLKPATPNYEALACELAEKQISVDLFLAPTAAFVDAATLVRVPRACGGRLFHYPAFDRARDAAALHRSLCTATSSVRAFDALLRVRTSTGLEAAGEYVGHFGRPQRGDDVAGPVFDSTQAIALELSVVSKLMEGTGGGGRAYAGGGGLSEDACVQCAVLFTDPRGQRRIRVHTMFANKTAVLADVFRLADVDAMVSFLAKKAASAVFSNGTPISKAREALVEKTVQSLFVYRKRCTSSSMSGQLILPEALKTLPVVILGLTKSSAFRSGVNASATDAVAVDERISALAFLVQANPADIASLGYPRMWDLTELAEEVGKPLPLKEPAVVGAPETRARDPNLEPIALPNTVPLSSSTLAEEKVLLVENGIRMACWIGEKVAKDKANDVIAQVAGGRLVIRAETAGSAELMKGASTRAQRIGAMVSRVTRERMYMSRPEVWVKSGRIAGMMVEDRGANGAHSYVEFLRFVHKKVMTRVANESAQNEMQTWEMLNNGY